MNHELFEMWLLADPDEDPLTVEQEMSLHAHLEGCPSCRRLASAWSEVEGFLHTSPPAEPEMGFTTRWEQRLEREKARLHLRQSFAALGFAVLGVVLALGSLAILALPLIESPSVLFWVWFYRLFSLVMELDTARTTFIDILGSFLGAFPPLAWILAAGVLSQLAVLWLVLYRKLTQSRSEIS